MTQARCRLAIVGWPVAHSVSPALWEAVGARRDIAIQYAALPIGPDDEEAWNAVWSSELDGFNVTAPYKEQAVARCDEVSPPATRIGAVNTVFRHGGFWEGHTTDGYGFVRSLLAEGEPLAGRSIAVLGTGGAGRAVARAAVDAGARVTLVSRMPERAVAGCADCERIGWSELGSNPFAIIVNATPLEGAGLPEVPPEAWNEDGLAVDLHYHPRVTGFLRSSAAAGARTLNGLGMLIHQACLGAALLFDRDPSAAESWEADFLAAARSTCSAG